MSRQPNGRSVPPIQVNVPILGQSVYMGCARGHVEQSAAPFTMVLPGPTGDPVALEICRACWLNFVAMFGARRLTDAEIEELRAAGTLGGPSPAVTQ